MTPLEHSFDEMMEMGNDCLKFAARHIAALPEAPSFTAGDPSLFRESEPPAEPGDLKSLLAEIGKAAKVSVNTAAPGFMAYIPGGGIFEAALADMIACSVNRYTGIYQMAPALVTLEVNAIKWLCRLMGYESGNSFGILTSGGSMANFSALITAREKYFSGRDFSRGRVYTSRQVHHSMKKAVKLAGFPADSLAFIDTEEDLKISLDELKKQIRQDRESGLSPFMITANAGTTNTGTVDPLPQLAEIAAGENLWLHVDGAYGGMFMLTERGKETLRGIEKADSITLDPHKGLFLPYGTGALLVKEEKYLYAAHHEDAVYLRDLEMNGQYNFTDFSYEMTRDYKGLRLWLPLKLHGLNRFRRLLDEKLDLARYAWKQLKDCCQIANEPALSAFAFRFLSADGDSNELNNRILAAVNEEKQVYLSSTALDGNVYLRFCILSFRTHRKQVEQAVKALKKYAARFEKPPAQ